MEKEKLVKLVVLIVILLIVFSTLGLTLWKFRFSGELECQVPAPEFCLKSPEGREYDESMFRGKKLILLYLRSSCPYCIKQFYNILKLSSNYNPLKTQIIAVMDKGKNLINSRALILIDQNNSFRKSYHVTFTPAMFLIDEKGILISYRNGYYGYRSDSLWISKFIDRKEAYNKP